MSKVEHPKGWVEVIAGCMYCGKTEELLRRMRRAEIAKQKVLLIKPSIDERYSVEDVASHNGTKMKAVRVPPKEYDLNEIWEQHDRPPVVGIDEGQFFEGLHAEVELLAELGVRVLISGLDLDYKGRPFLDPELFSIAEKVTKLTAICTVCAVPTPATRTFRISDENERVVIGSHGKYEARCRDHWS